MDGAQGWSGSWAERAARRAAPGLALLAALGPLCDARAEGSRVASGFVIAEARERLGRPAGAFACPAPVEPLLDMARFRSRYDPKDPTQSRVDPERERAEAARGTRLTSFGNGLAHLSDRAVTARPRDPEIARCVLRHLARWAEAGALLGSAADNDELGRHQAVMTQAWQLATYAAALVKIGPDGLDPGELARTRDWLGQLARSVAAEYTADNQWSRHGANHLYWAGLAVGYAGAALQDPDLRDFALRALRRGLADIDETGALPAEIARGSRAAVYQNFATLPLVALTRFADANGEALSPAEERALARLLAFNAGLARDPAALEARTGVKQAPARDRSSLAWIDVVLPRLRGRDPARAADLEDLAARFGARPAWHAFLGGNAGLVYNPADQKPER